MIEEKQGNNATTDGSISKVEYRTEEDEMLATPDRQPTWPMCIDDWEVEHIHYPTLEPRTVALANWYEGGQLRIRTLTEDDTIEHTVDDVSAGSGQNHGDTYDIPGLQVSLDDVDEIPKYQNNGNNTERCQEKLSKQLHAKGHAIVLGEKDLEPVSNVDATMQEHGSLYPNLDDLVNNEYT